MRPVAIEFLSALRTAEARDLAGTIRSYENMVSIDTLKLYQLLTVAFYTPVKYSLCV